MLLRAAPTPLFLRQFHADVQAGNAGLLCKLRDVSAAWLRVGDVAAAAAAALLDHRVGDRFPALTSALAVPSIRLEGASLTEPLLCLRCRGASGRFKRGLGPSPPQWTTGTGPYRAVLSWFVGRV